jgi:acetate kinase
MILVVNAGSSTCKCALFALAHHSAKPLPDPLWEGTAEFKRKDPQSEILALLKTIRKGPQKVIDGPEQIGTVGHRVVHGGELYQDPIVITAKVKAAIRALEPLAPLHNLANLQGIEIIEKLIPTAQQVAVFDTGFFKTLPEWAATYPVPLKWKKEGVRRYGFHGISHGYCTKRAAELLKSSKLKIVSCHLGNGCSLAAVEKGKCIDTTMGYTPLEGLMMGTRCGSIDPGILLTRLRTKKETPSELDEILNFESGFKGIVGTQDLRKILKLAEQGDQKATLSLDMFVHSLVRNIGAMTAVLGGVDVLLFTGGIGENSAEIRERVCTKLAFLGIRINSRKNRSKPVDSTITAHHSTCQVMVIHTRENFEIAQACAQVLE